MTDKFLPDHDLNEAKKVWQRTRDPKKALKLIKKEKKGTFESKWLVNLMNFQNDFSASFNKVSCVNF